MAKVITENFKVETTNELFESFKNQNDTLSANFLAQLQAYETQNSLSLSDTNETDIQKLVDDQLDILRPEANYYIMASTALASIDGVPSISNTQESKRDFQRKVIFGNKISDASARYMFYENTWTTGTVYDAFADTKDIESSNTIVCVRNTEGEYLVFKCIENNNGSPSTISPQTVINQFATSNYQSVETGDKYIWHYMFTVGSDEADIYKTSDSLPLPTVGGDVNVIANAKECISQVIVETTPTGQFNQYLFGEATSVSNSSDVLIKNTNTSGSNTVVTVGVTDKIGRTLYNDSDAYKYMYFRSSNGATSGKLYDVVGSSSNDAAKEITLTLDTQDILTGSGQLVPKVSITSSTLDGVRAKAYGIIDEFGTLRRIAYETKGTKYKFATAEMVYPKSLTTPGTTTLRVVISPTGGHGSNPIDEIAMSRLSIVTNFAGDSTFIPDSNTYTQVGLLKNPTFTDGTGASVTPASFDNRISMTVTGSDVTSQAVAGKVVEQFIRSVDVQDMLGNTEYVITNPGNLTANEWSALAVGTISGTLGETFTSVASPSVGSDKIGSMGTVVDSLSPDHDEEILKAKIHESVYANSNTTIFLVDYYGDFENKFQKGNIRIKDAFTDQAATTININSTITYGSYDPYTGELLHFIDFAPITRTLTTKEKVKFTFDF